MVSSVRKAGMAAFVVLALVTAMFASPVAADKKHDLEQQKKGVNGKIDSAKKQYDESSKAFADAVAALRAAQAKLDRAKNVLGKTRGELATAEARDRQMQAKLDQSEAELETAIARLKVGEAKLEQSELEVQRFTVESLQEGDRGLQAFGDLLRGESPTQFSERMALNDSVSDAQLATMQRLAASKVILRLNRDRVQKLRDQVAAARAAAAANLILRQRLEAAAEKQKLAVDELVSDRSTARNKANAIRKADAKRLKQLENERASLNARLAALAAKGGGKGAGGDSGGTLSRPVNGPITSPYGMRWHPITHVYKLHDGTDFGVPCGTPVRAAASGKIIEQYYNGGYGNRVILNNGIKRGVNVVTTYNHLSRFKYRTGTHVKRGQVIAYSGTTGYSTGCHLHFMVITNGHTVNPMGWL